MSSGGFRRQTGRGIFTRVFLCVFNHLKLNTEHLTELNFSPTLRWVTQFLQIKNLHGSKTHVRKSHSRPCVQSEACCQQFEWTNHRPALERAFGFLGYLKASRGLNRTWTGEVYSVGSRSWTLTFHLAACLMLDDLTLIHEVVAWVIHRFQISKWESVEIEIMFLQNQGCD